MAHETSGPVGAGAAGRLDPTRTLCYTAGLPWFRSVLVLAPSAYGQEDKRMIKGLRRGGFAATLVAVAAAFVGTTVVAGPAWADGDPGMPGGEAPPPGAPAPSAGAPAPSGAA